MRSIQRAAKGSETKRRRDKDSDSDSEESSDEDKSNVRRKTTKQMQKELMLEKEAAKRLKRELAEIKAANEASRTALAACEVLTLTVSVVCIEMIFLTCWLTQTPQQPQQPRTPVQAPDTRRVLAFHELRTHENMKLINSWMCPWLIAVYGKDFADTDNAEAAMEMLEWVVVKHEIANFTEESFAETKKGHRMELLTFTKFVLTRVGKFFF
jgi:hypothetical protein